MSDLIHPEDPTTTPTIEVSVYLGASLLRRDYCETEPQAAAVISHWEEQPGVECEVRDLSATRSDPSFAEVTWTDPAMDHPLDDAVP